ncbi:MAG TPA: SpoIIE family protein phosphatase [Thermoanaerobaculia bacterium]|nr:SpoIIE family protein phosphatase [Thermoanaerobaculia bacterium]
MESSIYRLHIAPAEGAPFDFFLERESVVVGRSIDADLVIEDPFLSRRHSRLFRVGGALLVEDLGSRNGTFVNEQPVLTAAPVRPGDVVRISATTLTVHLEDQKPQEQEAVAAVEEPLDATVFRRAAELLQEWENPTESRLHGEEALRRYAGRLKVLNDVHQALGRPLTLFDLLELILDRVFDHLQPDRAAIFLRGPDGEVRVAASRSAGEETRPGSPADLPVSRSLTREVLDKGMAALVLDILADERFSTAQSMLLSGVRSLVAAPLLTPEGTPGLIILESQAGARQFSEEDLELLVSLASVAALHLRNLRLTLEAAERRRLEEELVLARRIQTALLPDHLPKTPGWSLHGMNVPSRGVSGDYYEVVTRRDGKELVLMIADVSGKGMGASLLTISLQALSEGPVEDGLPPDEICVRLSRQLFRRTPPEKYATAFLGVLEVDTGLLRYTNAGHNPALLVRADGTAEELAATGPPLGLFSVTPYSAAEKVLAPGDLLVLYTDGFVEAMDPEGEEYGLERLQAVCVRHAEDGEALAAALDQDLEEFVRGVPCADDRTLVTARRLGN